MSFIMRGRLPCSRNFSGRFFLLLSFYFFFSSSVKLFLPSGIFSVDSARLTLND
jgi:hypothetical protein